MREVKRIEMPKNGAMIRGEGFYVEAKPVTLSDGTEYVRVEVAADKDRFAGEDHRLFDFTGKDIRERQPVPEDARIFAVVDTKRSRQREEKIL